MFIVQWVCGGIFISLIIIFICYKRKMEDNKMNYFGKIPDKIPEKTNYVNLKDTYDNRISII